jgi:hypothetical protein
VIPLPFLWQSISLLCLSLPEASACSERIQHTARGVSIVLLSLHSLDGHCLVGGWPIHLEQTNAREGGPFDIYSGEEVEDEKAMHTIALGEAAMLEAQAILEKARTSALCDHMGNFGVMPLGGTWTVAHAGMSVDALQVRAVGREVEQLLYLMRFDISLYTTAGVMTCVMYLAHGIIS